MRTMHTRKGQLFIVRSAGNDPSAHDAAQLHRRKPHSAGCTEHCEALVRLQVRAVLEGVVGGAVRDRERGGALEIETVRELDNAARCDGRALPRGVEIGVPHDAVARGKAGYSGSDAFDNSCKLPSRREWEGWFGLVLAGDDQGVEEIEANGLDFGHYLPRARDGVGNVREDEIIRGTKPVAEDRFHGGVARQGGDLLAFTLPDLPSIGLMLAEIGDSTETDR